MDRFKFYNHRNKIVKLFLKTGHNECSIKKILILLENKWCIKNEKWFAKSLIFRNSKNKKIEYKILIKNDNKICQQLKQTKKR